MSNNGIVDLNNYLQSKGRLTSLSWEDSTSGPPHTPQWISVCKIDGKTMGKGTGAQKQIAKDVAATEALKKLKDNAETSA